MTKKINSFDIDMQTGLVRDVAFVESPNCDERPVNITIDVLVIHAISLPPGCFGGSEVEHFFCNQLDCSAHSYFQEIQSLQVSAHFYIRRTGRLLQFVPVTKRAWHAGVSSFQGRERVNDFSVGIELEGSDYRAFTDAQYTCLAYLSKSLMSMFPSVTPENIIGHAHVAPGRKTDPGPYFDWERFRGLLL